MSILFSTNSQKVLHFFINHPLQDFMENEIQKVIGISRSGLNYAVRDLVSAGFLYKTKRGNSFFFVLNHKNLIVKQLKIIETITQIENLLKQLASISSTITLFGSSCRGEDTIDSDIDLLVISHRKDDVLEQIEKYKSTRKIQCIVFTNLGFIEKKKTDPVFYQEVNKGIVLWEDTHHKF